MAWFRWVATTVFVVASLGTAVRATTTGSLPGHLTAGLCALAGLAALLARQRWPVLVLIAETVLLVAATVVQHSNNGSIQVIFLAVAAYGYVSWTEGRQTLPTVGVCWLVVALSQLATGAHYVQLGLSELFLLGASTAIGLYVRSHRALLASLRDRAEQAEREQDWAAARAVAQERVRIARELHDVVAHHVSLLVIQAGAVRESLPADHPTRKVLDSMIAGGRTSMAELRHLLDALRAAEDVADRTDRSGGGDSSAASRHPQPGLDELPALVERARGAGLQVELVTLGRPQAVLPVTSLAAYRIVQEALTNVVKHAPGASTMVEVTYYPDSVVLRVANGAPPPAVLLAPPPEIRAQQASRSGPLRVGLGVVGMRERAALCGGQLRAARCGDGFEVTARLPARPTGSV